MKMGVGRELRAVWATGSKSSPRFPSLGNLGTHWLVGPCVPFQVYVLDGWFCFWMVTCLLWESYFFEEAWEMLGVSRRAPHTQYVLWSCRLCPTWYSVQEADSMSWWHQTCSEFPDTRPPLLAQKYVLDYFLHLISFLTSLERECSFFPALTFLSAFKCF